MAAATLGTLAQAAGVDTAHAAESSSLGFSEVRHGQTRASEVADGYRTQVVMRWGDRVVDASPTFNVANQTASAQEGQFGYNNDFVAFLPLPRGSENSDHGLLCVNHEFTDAQMMFSGLTKKDRLERLSKEQVDIEMAATGHSVIEIKLVDGTWKIVRGKYNRRISALSTEMRISGPAAGHHRMRTKHDPTGKTIVGTINDCSGGTTPWGTVLMGEENFQHYFGGNPANSPEANCLKDYGVDGKPKYAWSKYYDLYDIEKEPNGPNCFGWVVELDPYDPKSVPVKRTALGRMRHEAATTVVSADGRLVVYSGDDDRGEYFYKFVSRFKCDPTRPEANKDLLDFGTLYVARFESDGTLRWLPLTFGKGPLTAENDFFSQADVMIETRRAADLLGATPMDRPEDAETNPQNGRVYVMLTNNMNRKPDETDAANPRAYNKHGHIIELIPPHRGGRVDHAADSFRWEALLQAGDPYAREDKAKYHEDVTKHGWLTCPDNCAFDKDGRLWITTDGAPKAKDMSDGVYVCDVDGPGRALTKHFFRGPRGAEICGPAFTPDSTTMFLAVQHPGEGKHEDGITESTFDHPSTRWPDFNQALPPRPAVVAIRHKDGGAIGS